MNSKFSKIANYFRRLPQNKYKYPLFFSLYLFLNSISITSCANEPVSATWFTRLPANKLPEGLTTYHNKIFIGVATTQKIYFVDSHGNLHLYASLPHLKNGLMTGIIFDQQGNLYAALDSNNPDIPAGIYKVKPGGGLGTLYSSGKDLIFPNGFTFDQKQNLYVADSLSNTIIKITPKEKNIVWYHSSLLIGSPNFCPEKGAGKPIGANGIIYVKKTHSIIVDNTDKATLISIPLLKNGKPGKPHILMHSQCALIAGADGIIYKYGKIFIAVNRQNKLLSVNINGQQPKILYQGTPLDFPASPIIMGKDLFVTNFSLKNHLQKPYLAKPGIIKVTLPDS